jgi:hypothetical protein
MSSQAQKAPVGEHAVVLGGSMAGLLAARVLAAFRTVTVVERDTLGNAAAVRKGVYLRAGTSTGCSCGVQGP